jgi:hypothetical protein
MITTSAGDKGFTVGVSTPTASVAAGVPIDGMGVADLSPPLPAVATRASAFWLPLRRVSCYGPRMSIGAVRSPGVIARDSRSLYLIVQFALKDFKIRYSHTALGYVWSVLSPLIFTLTYYFVFSVFIRFEVINYPGYLLLGIVLWSFFSEGTSHGATSLLARGGIVTKIPMRRELIVYAAVLNAMISFVINLAVLGARALGDRLTHPVVDRDVPDRGARRGHADDGRVAPPRADPRAVPRRRAPVDRGAAARLLAHADRVRGYHGARTLAVARRPEPDGARALTVAGVAHLGTWTSPSIMFGTTMFAGLVLLAGWLVFQRLQARIVEYY